MHNEQLALASRLKNARKNANLTQDQVAQKPRAATYCDCSNRSGKPSREHSGIEQIGTTLWLPNLQLFLERRHADRKKMPW